MNVSSRIPEAPGGKDEDDPELSRLRPISVCSCPWSGLLYALCSVTRGGQEDEDEEQEKVTAFCVAVIDSTGLLVNTIGVPGGDDVGSKSNSLPGAGWSFCEAKLYASNKTDQPRADAAASTIAKETPAECVRRLKREELKQEKEKRPLLARTKQEILGGGLAPVGTASRTRKRKSQSDRGGDDKIGAIRRHFTSITSTGRFLVLGDANGCVSVLDSRQQEWVCVWPACDQMAVLSTYGTPARRGPVSVAAATEAAVEAAPRHREQ